MPQTKDRVRWVIICDPDERRNALSFLHVAKEENLRVRLIDVSHKLRPYPTELADATGLILFFHRPDGYPELFESFKHLDKLQRGALIIAANPRRYPEAIRRYLESVVQHVHYSSQPPWESSHILKVMKGLQDLE